MSLKELWEKDQAAIQVREQNQSKNQAAEQDAYEVKMAAYVEENKRRRIEKIKALEAHWQDSGIQELFREAAEIKHGKVYIQRNNGDSRSVSKFPGYPNEPYIYINLEWKVRRPSENLLERLIPEYNLYSINAYVYEDRISLINKDIPLEKARDREFVEQQVLNALNSPFESSTVPRDIDHFKPDRY